MNADLSLELYDPPIPHTPAELSHLEHSLRTDGLLDPLLVWQADDGRLVLLDGAARKTLCDKLGIRPRVKRVRLPDRDAAAEFRLRTQVGRRNLTPLLAAYQRGHLYTLLGRRQGLRTDLVGHAADWERTAAGIATASGVSERTVRRDGEFYRAAARLFDLPGVGAAFRDAVLVRRRSAPRSLFVMLAGMADTEEVRRGMEAFLAATPGNTRRPRPVPPAPPVPPAGPGDPGPDPSDPAPGTPTPPAAPAVTPPAAAPADRLLAAWRAAGADDRRAFLRHPDVAPHLPPAASGKGGRS